jgi:hypothetical protein
VIYHLTWFDWLLFGLVLVWLALLGLEIRRFLK